MLDLRYITILKVALPLMASSFIQSVVMITDSAFLSRYSINDFDAAGNAGLIYITVFIALVGMSDGAQILFARRIGQKNYDALGRIFGTTILTQLMLASLLFAFIQLLMPSLLQSYSKHADLADSQSVFIKIRSYALFFAMISLSIQAYFLAHGRTLVVLLSALLTASSNILMDYTFIFGHFGFDAHGLEGAAWASTLADGLGMTFLVTFLLISKKDKQYRLFDHFSFNLSSLKELFRIGSPIMLQGLIALATWTIFFTWIEQVGKFELTVSQNIRSIYFLAFVPIWGFGATTKTYISQYLGRMDFDSLRIIQRRIQLLSLLFLFLFFHGGMLYPETLVSWINPEVHYVQKSGEIMRFVSFSIILFSFFSVYFQTINGSGNTLVTFLIEGASVSVYIVASFLLIKVFQVDIFWVWSVEYLYFMTMGLLSILYLRTYPWQHKVV